MLMHKCLTSRYDEIISIDYFHHPCDSLVTAPLDGIEISVVQWETTFGNAARFRYFHAKLALPNVVSHWPTEILADRNAT
jgi:hypothetical protein